jgi:hypothetical protein
MPRGPVSGIVRHAGMPSPNKIRRKTTSWEKIGESFSHWLTPHRRSPHSLHPLDADSNLVINSRFPHGLRPAAAHASADVLDFRSSQPPRITVKDEDDQISTLTEIVHVQRGHSKYPQYTCLTYIWLPAIRVDRNPPLVVIALASRQRREVSNPGTGRKMGANPSTYDQGINVYICPHGGEDSIELQLW